MYYTITIHKKESCSLISVIIKIHIINKYMNIKKYIWLAPALYVSYEFANKIIEVLSDNTEIAGIVSVLKPLSGIANMLSYAVGILDLAIALALLTFSLSLTTKPYHKYIFIWTIFWPFVPASIRYFGGVGDFEIVQVLSISISAVVAYVLYSKYN